MSSLSIVRGTMIVATAAWAAGEALMKRSPLSDRWARAIWTIGIAFALIHVALAFHLVYAWDHEAAVAATARQTADRIGWSWRGGIYVNYVFLATWLVDVCWWWLRARIAPIALDAIREDAARRVHLHVLQRSGRVRLGNRTPRRHWLGDCRSSRIDDVGDRARRTHDPRDRRSTPGRVDLLLRLGRAAASPRWRWSERCPAGRRASASSPSRCSRDLGVDRVRFAQINLVATLVGALFCFGIGGLVDRLGSRVVLTPLAVALGARRDAR